MANFVSPEYFTILHIPLVEGRLWEQSEVLAWRHAGDRQPDICSPIFSRRGRSEPLCAHVLD